MARDARAAGDGGEAPRSGSIGRDTARGGEPLAAVAERLTRPYAALTGAERAAAAGDAAWVGRAVGAAIREETPDVRLPTREPAAAAVAAGVFVTLCLRARPANGAGTGRDGPPGALAGAGWWTLAARDGAAARDPRVRVVAGAIGDALRAARRETPRTLAALAAHWGAPVRAVRLLGAARGGRTLVARPDDSEAWVVALSLTRAVRVLAHELASGALWRPLDEAVALWTLARQLGDGAAGVAEAAAPRWQRAAGMLAGNAWEALVGGAALADGRTGPLARDAVARVVGLRGDEDVPGIAGDGLLTLALVDPVRMGVRPHPPTPPGRGGAALGAPALAAATALAVRGRGGGGPRLPCRREPAIYVAPHPGRRRTTAGVETARGRPDP